MGCIEDPKSEPEMLNFGETLSINVDENRYLEVLRASISQYKNKSISNLNLEIFFALKDKNTPNSKIVISDILEELKIKVSNINLTIITSQKNQKLSDIVLIMMTFIYNQFFMGNFFSQIFINSSFILKHNSYYYKKTDDGSKLNYIYTLYNKRIIKDLLFEDIIYMTNLKEFNYNLDFTETNLFNQNKEEFNLLNTSINTYFQLIRNSDSSLIKANRLFFVYYIGLYFFGEQFLTGKRKFEKSNNNLLLFSKNLQENCHLTPYSVFIIDAFWVKDIGSFNYFASFFNNLFFYFKEIIVIFEMSSDQKELLSEIHNQLIIEKSLSKLVRSIHLRKIRIIIFQSNKIVYDYNLICSQVFFSLFQGQYSQSSKLKQLKKNMKIHKILFKFLV